MCHFLTCFPPTENLIPVLQPDRFSFFYAAPIICCDIDWNQNQTVKLGQAAQFRQNMNSFCYSWEIVASEQRFAINTWNIRSPVWHRGPNGRGLSNKETCHTNTHVLYFPLVKFPMLTKLLTFMSNFMVKQSSLLLLYQVLANVCVQVIFSQWHHSNEYTTWACVVVWRPGPAEIILQMAEKCQW